MSNPLLDKYEEIYGEKKEEEVVEEKKPSIDEFRDSFLSGLRGGMADDIITMGGGTDTISLNPYDTKPVFTINGGSEIMDSGAFVIPAATINNGAMSMDGSYFKPATITSTSTPNTFLLPQTTEMDKQLCKVMDDVAKGKAVVSEIKSEVDPTFTGFGGQIRYSIEIVGKYP